MLYLFLVLALLLPQTKSAQENEIDLFMQEVFENRQKSYEYMKRFNFVEDEEFEIVDSVTGRVLNSRISVFDWRSIEGQLVRTPRTVNSVAVSESERREYEKTWMTQGRAGKRRADLQEDSFFHFMYEPGRYFLSETVMMNGRTTYIINYYPSKHFQENGRDPIGSRGDRYDSAFDKTSNVAFLVDAETKYISQIEFSNEKLNYLPYSWLVKLKNFQTTISYTLNETGNWLPEIVELTADLADADATRNVRVIRRFHDYVKPKITINYQIIDDDSRN
jgi:hypothetical protein